MQQSLERGEEAAWKPPLKHEPPNPIEILSHLWCQALLLKQNVQGPLTGSWALPFRSSFTWTHMFARDSNTTQTLSCKKGIALFLVTKVKSSIGLRGNEPYMWCPLNLSLPHTFLSLSFCLHFSPLHSELFSQICFTPTPQGENHGASSSHVCIFTWMLSRLPFFS